LLKKIIGRYKITYFSSPMGALFATHKSIRRKKLAENSDIFIKRIAAKTSNVCFMHYFLSNSAYPERKNKNVYSSNKI